MTGITQPVGRFKFKSGLHEFLRKVYRKLFPYSYAETLRKMGAKVGENVFLDGITVDHPFVSLLEIEDNVTLAFGCQIWMHDAVLNTVFGLPVSRRHDISSQ